MSVEVGAVAVEREHEEQFRFRRGEGTQSEVKVGFLSP
jgi:hypothetical protein